MDFQLPISDICQYCHFSLQLNLQFSELNITPSVGPNLGIFKNFWNWIPYPLECSPMGVKVLPQKRTVVIITVLFWVNTFTPMGLHSSGYGISSIKKVFWNVPICLGCVSYYTGIPRPTRFFIVRFHLPSTNFWACKSL